MTYAIKNTDHRLPFFFFPGVLLTSLTLPCPPCIAPFSLCALIRSSRLFVRRFFFSHRAGSGAGRSFSGKAAIRLGNFDLFFFVTVTGVEMAFGRERRLGSEAIKVETGVDSSTSNGGSVSDAEESFVGMEERKSSCASEAFRFVERSACSGESYTKYQHESSESGGTYDIGCIEQLFIDISTELILFQLVSLCNPQRLS